MDGGDVGGKVISQYGGLSGLELTRARAVPDSKSQVTSTEERP